MPLPGGSVRTRFPTAPTADWTPGGSGRQQHPRSPDSRDKTSGSPPVTAATIATRETTLKDPKFPLWCNEVTQVRKEARPVLERRPNERARLVSQSVNALPRAVHRPPLNPPDFPQDSRACLPGWLRGPASPGDPW
ncbi:hypothetical protein NDU88_010206 [Pleurodeles waltl]|uniref:Uncharacterized protein n=1 Tax=Pleurodeles waltl TaxID=8319 RepID=A0AAV7QVQ8_PLEWA|nr:hypothetical protein NDU88_010206 [Pleurodeles waltl]